MKIKLYTIKLSIIKFLLILIKYSYANTFEILKIEDKISEIMVNLIRNCYQRDVVLSGDWNDDDFHKINIHESPIPVKILGLKEDIHFMRHKRLSGSFKMNTAIIRKKKYPGANFIIVVKSNNTLHEALKLLRKSLLWNHQGSFFIICRNVEDRCKTAHAYLSLIWSFHILHATLLCTDDAQDPQLYTFNPFTNRGPEFWRISQKDDGRNYSLTFYKKLANSSSNECSKCTDQKFDKIRNLDGYAIKIGVYRHTYLLPYDDSKSGLARFGGVDGDTFLALWNYFNATGDIKYYSKPGLVEEEGSLQKFLKDLLPNKIEIAMNGNLLRDFWRLQTYPHDIKHYCIVSRKYSIKYVFVDFELIYGFKGLCLMFITCCIAMIVLKYLLKNSMSVTLLELIRMISNVPVHSKLQTLSKSVMFIFIYSLIIVFNKYFYCHLISLKVVPYTYPTIDTDTDLNHTDMFVYGTLNYAQHLSDLDIKDRYRYGQLSDCMNRLRKGSRIICIAQCSEIKLNAYEARDIRVSKSFRTFFRAYSISEDWPFHFRVNDLLMRLSEGGFILHFKHKQLYRYSKIMDETQNTHIVLLENTITNWLFWFGGISIATTIFISELFFQNIQNMLPILRK